MAQHDYGFTLYVRRLDEWAWLPMAVNTRGEADAMIAHVLGEGGPYDVVRVVERLRPGAPVFVDRGERHARKILADPALTA